MLVWDQERRLVYGGQEGERYGVGRGMRYTFIHQSGDRVNGGSTITGYILDIVDSSIVHLLLLYIHIACVVCSRHLFIPQVQYPKRINEGKTMEVNSREQKRSTKPQHMQGKQPIIYPCPSPLANSRPFHFSVLIRVFGIDKSFGGDMQPMATDRYGVL